MRFIGLYKYLVSKLAPFIVIALAIPQLAAAKDFELSGVLLEVIDPYLALHPGPGRGYPILYVIEEGEGVVVLTRQPGWYEVLSQSNQVGWVSESQIARTMQKSGEPADLPSVSYGDYLNKGWQVGFAAGAFSSGELQGADNLKLSAGYRPISWLVIEAETGRFYAPETRGSYMGLNLVAEPISKWKFSPAILYGMGTMKIESQPELVPLGFSDSDLKSYGLRLNYYVGRNFVVNIEQRWFDISSENNNLELEGWFVGFNTFF